MLIGRKINNSEPDPIYVVFVLGQSNASGRGEVARLANTDFNYKGISTGYPSVRSGQDQYVENPAGVHIYWKGDSKTFANLTTDNGAWAAYVASTNSSFDMHATLPTCNYFGIELPVATLVKDATGKDVYIIKCAIGGTSLTQNSSSTDPGQWNFTINNIACEFFIKKAIRDLRIAAPGKRIVPLTVVWWQGEQDASDGASAATYQSEFLLNKKIIDSAIKQALSYESAYNWNLVKISYDRNAAETVINTALASIVAANSDCHLINIDAYPRKFDLSSEEAAPITAVPTTGITSPTNSAGGVDNHHSSYITILAAGEKVFANIIF